MIKQKSFSISRVTPLLVFVASLLTLGATEACNKATSPTAPTPTPVVTTPVTPVTPTPTVAGVPVLTLTQDTPSPVGQAVAITYASRNQEAGKITVAVTGFNLQNQISPGVVGVSSIEGRLKYDDAVLEIERTTTGIDAGDFMRQGGVGIGCCRSNWPVTPGLYPFFVGRNAPKVQGSGELFLARFSPRAGVTSATTRIELMPFNASEAEDARFNFIASLLTGPFAAAPKNMIDNVYGATVTIRPGS
jgi:hypothetical protein